MPPANRWPSDRLAAPSASTSLAGSPHSQRSRHEPPGGGSPALVRFLLTCDGCGYASFDDNTVFVLSPTAAAFQLVRSDSVTRQLTACATSSLRLRVAAALHVHNAVSPARPLLLPSLLPPPEAAPALATSSEAPPAHLHHCTHRVVSGLVWSNDAAAATRGHAVAHSDGSVRVFSVDRLGWLLLDPELASFEVCFPAAISREAVDDQFDFAPLGQLPAAASQPNAGAGHDYASLWPPAPSQRSLFFRRMHSALGDIPTAWRHPLHIARCLSRRLADRSCTHGDASYAAPPAGTQSQSDATPRAVPGVAPQLCGEDGVDPAGAIPKGGHGLRLSVSEGGKSRLPVVVGGWCRRADAPILNAQLLGGGVEAEACLRGLGGGAAPGLATRAALVHSDVAPMPEGCAEALASVVGAAADCARLAAKTDTEGGVYIPLPAAAGSAASHSAGVDSCLLRCGAGDDPTGALAMSALPPPARALEMIAAGATSGAVPQVCAASVLLTPHAIFRAHPAAATLAACEDDDEEAAAEVAAWQVAEAWAGGGGRGDDAFEDSSGCDGNGESSEAQGGRDGDAGRAAAAEAGSAVPPRLSVAVASALASAAAGDAAARGSLALDTWRAEPPSATEAAYGVTMSLLATGEVVGLERALHGGWVRLTPGAPRWDAAAAAAGGQARWTRYSAGCLLPTARVAAGWGGDGIPASARFGALCALGEGLWRHRLSLGKARDAGATNGRGGGGYAALSGLAQRGVGRSALWEELDFASHGSDAAGGAGEERNRFSDDSWWAQGAGLQTQGEQASWERALGSYGSGQDGEVGQGEHRGGRGDSKRLGASPATDCAPRAASPPPLPRGAPSSAPRGPGTNGGQRLSGDASEVVENVSVDVSDAMEDVSLYAPEVMGDVSMDASKVVKDVSTDASKVVKDVSLPASGRFRRFGDGRVAVAFHDRTLLTLAASGSAAAQAGSGRSSGTGQRPWVAGAVPSANRWLTTTQEEWYVCRLVLPSGHTTTVRSDNPIGFGRYVAAAVEFLKWAERTPGERVAHNARQRQQRHALATELRRIDRALFMGGANQDRVAAAAAGGGGEAHGTALVWQGEATAAADKGSGWVDRSEGEQLGHVPRHVPGHVSEPVSGCSSTTGLAGGLGSVARVEAELRKLDEALHNQEPAEALGASWTHRDHNNTAARSAGHSEGSAASCAEAIAACGLAECDSGCGVQGGMAAGGAVAGAGCFVAAEGELRVRFELERIRDFLERSA